MNWCLQTQRRYEMTYSTSLAACDSRYSQSWASPQVSPLVRKFAIAD